MFISCSGDSNGNDSNANKRVKSVFETQSSISASMIQSSGAIDSSMVQKSWVIGSTNITHNVEFNEFNKVHKVITWTPGEIHDVYYIYTYNEENLLIRWDHYESRNGITEPELVHYILFTYNESNRLIHRHVWYNATFDDNDDGIRETAHWYCQQIINYIYNSDELIEINSNHAVVNFLLPFESQTITYRTITKEEYTYTNNLKTSTMHTFNMHTTPITHTYYYDYDTEGRLIRIKYPSSEINFTYAVISGLEVIKSKDDGSTKTEYNYELENGIDDSESLNWYFQFHSIQDQYFPL